MNTTTYYLVSTEYHGPRHHYRYDDILDFITISTEPVRSQIGGAPRISGWLGSRKNSCWTAHGAYPTLEGARGAIQYLAPGATLATDAEMRRGEENHGVVEYWLPCALVLAAQLPDWADDHLVSYEVAIEISALAAADFASMERLWADQRGRSRCVDRGDGLEDAAITA